MFPVPYTAQWMARVPGPPDDHGTPTWTFADPVPVPVIGWAPPAADQQSFDPTRTAVVRDLDLMAPQWPGGPQDRALVGGLLYAQIGHPEDFNHGPFGFEPGVRVSLKRVEEAG